MDTVRQITDPDGLRQRHTERQPELGECYEPVRPAGQ
jgi:hypothetical protein